MDRDNTNKATGRALSRIGEDPGLVAAVEAIIATLADISLALTPIIGQHGVAALYKRSLFVCVVRQACLADVAAKTASHDDGLDLSPLRAALLLQDAHTVNVCSNDLLNTLNQLLTSLIGASLCERLLRSAWENSLCGQPPQDTLL
ncbi:MAG: hypothetical protein AAAB16_13280 [Pseudomonas sp.]|uniref:hypothetical protein n=1 Tax=Pseudomonas sp. TaxID=306 RepID=UPI0030F2D181